MAQIKWIKLTTDIFENRKIRRLRSQRNGDKMTLLYIMLLTMAGRCNDGGRVFYTRNIPYTEKTLGAELGFSEQQMQVWLKTLSDYALIEVDTEGFVYVLGWESHQNVEKLDLIREQNKQRKRRQREREKAENGEKAHAATHDGHVTVTLCHAAEEDIDKDKEEDKEREEDKEKGADALHTLSSLFSQHSFSSALQARAEDWVHYKAERAEGYTERGLKALLRQIETNVSRYGETAVCELMELSMASGWKNIVFERLEKPPSARPLPAGEIRPEDYETGPKYPWDDFPQAEEKTEGGLYPW